VFWVVTLTVWMNVSPPFSLSMDGVTIYKTTVELVTAAVK
jgi:hypothetical protein